MLKLNLQMSRAVFFLASLAIVVVDQLSKGLAQLVLGYDGIIAVVPGLSLRLAHNYGAAFSVLSDAGGWQRWFFIVFSSLVSLLLVVWVLRTKREERWLSFALALILGGGVGNLIDRVSLGYVVDFISVFYKHHVFPTFNVADSAISVGAAMIIIDMLFFEPARARRS